MRRPSTRRLSAGIWYWIWLLRFAVTYRGGGGDRSGGRVRGAAWHLRYAGRTLVRRPGLSLAVLLTLGVGLGATALAYALVDGVLLRPLPYPGSEELVDISRVDPDWFGGPPSAAEAADVFATPFITVLDWQRMARSFTAMGAFAGRSATFTGSGEPVHVQGVVAMSGVFAALGSQPLIGRTLLEEDDVPGASPVVLLGYGFWVRHFGADRAVVGADVQLDGIARTVIGVMPEAFVFPDDAVGFWVNFDDAARSSPRRNAGYLHAVARLAPGTTLEQGRAEMADITVRLGEVEPEEQEFRAYVFPFREMQVAGIRPGILLLLCAAVVVLLVGAANVSGLFLSRVAERQREFALHTALGAGRGRLVGLVLAESLPLAVLGGAAGLGAASASLRPFLAALPMAIPRADRIHVDFGVLAVTLALSVATGIFIAVLPALRSGRVPVNATLRDGGHGSTFGREKARAQGFLVAAEVALAVLLLSTSGLFLQSHLLSMRRERGFRSDDVLTMPVSVPAAYRESWGRVRSFFADLMERLDAVPGVVDVGMANQMPLAGGYSSPPASVETASGVVEGAVHTSVVTPEYFAVMDIPITAGRGLVAADREGSAPVVVVSEAMARRFWPDGDALGRRVRLETGDDAPWREIVGIARSVRYGYAGSEMVEYYRPWDQDPTGYGVLVIRTQPGADVAAAVMRTTHELEATLPVTVTPLAELARREYDYRWAK
ncbi:MAG: ABC transporter permease, partial [Gemmatimonadota bacterium]